MALPPALAAVRLAMLEESEKFRALNDEERAGLYGIKNQRVALAVLAALDGLVETLDTFTEEQIPRVRLIRLLAVINSVKALIDQLPPVEQIAEDWPGTDRAVEYFGKVAEEIQRLRPGVELH